MKFRYRSGNCSFNLLSILRLNALSLWQQPLVGEHGVTGHLTLHRVTVFLQAQQEPGTSFSRIYLGTCYTSCIIDSFLLCYCLSRCFSYYRDKLWQEGLGDSTFRLWQIKGHGRLFNPFLGSEVLKPFKAWQLGVHKHSWRTALSYSRGAAWL